MNVIKEVNNVAGEGHYEWQIDNWEQLQNEKYIYSPEFKAGGKRWYYKINFFSF